MLNSIGIVVKEEEYFRHTNSKTISFQSEMFLYKYIHYTSNNREISVKQQKINPAYKLDISFIIVQ